MKVRNNKSLFKRIISGISALVMSGSIVPTISVSAEIGCHHFDYDGYTVDYDQENDYINIREYK